jgi:hypothetical protein
MKMKVAIFVIGLLLIGGNLYAANGDLIVNGNLSVGTGVTFPDGSIQTTAKSPATQNYVTASRVLGTVYQNTTGKPMFVAASIRVGIYGTAFAYSGSANPPTTQVVKYVNGSPNSSAYGELFFIVLPDNYYRVTGVDISSWIEWY